MKLGQDLTLGVNKYPNDMTVANEILSKWRINAGNKLARVKGAKTRVIQHPPRPAQLQNVALQTRVHKSKIKIQAKQKIIHRCQE